MTFRVPYMTGECWQTFRDGFTCSTSPHEILDADWSNSVTCLKYSILIGRATQGRLLLLAFTVHFSPKRKRKREC